MLGCKAGHTFTVEGLDASAVRNARIRSHDSGCDDSDLRAMYPYIKLSYVRNLPPQGYFRKRARLVNA
jgi:hypothetical protein